MERLTTYGDVWWDFFPTLIVFPTDIKRLTTYLTAYGGIFPTLIPLPTRNV